MAKGLDQEQVTKIVLATAQDIFTRICKVPPTDSPTTESHKLIEYQGRMSVNPMKKFNAPAYASGISFYLSTQDKDKNKAVGAIALCIEASLAEKFLKNLGYSVGDDEEEEEILNSCGKFCTAFAEGLKKELQKAGCPELVIGTPVNDKNSLPDGVAFGASHPDKLEASFYFWKRKVLAVDAVLGNIPTTR